MKKIYLPLVLIIMFLLSGCYAVQIGIGVASIIGPPLKSNGSSNESDIILGTQTETVPVGNYQVKVSRGSRGDDSCTWFAVYTGTVRNHLMFYLDRNAEDVKEIAEFNKMNLLEKKDFIKRSFSKHGIYLDPAEKSPKTTAVSKP